MLAAAAAVALAVALAGCGGGVQCRSYVKANHALFERLPTYPGARLRTETSTAYRSDDSGPVSGYGTRFELDLPPSATAATVGAFYRRRLEPQWRLVERLDGPVLNFRRARAFVSINLDNAPVHRLEIAVDHSYYGKLGR
jgi:hypothetical protein